MPPSEWDLQSSGVEEDEVKSSRVVVEVVEVGCRRASSSVPVYVHLESDTPCQQFLTPSAPFSPAISHDPTPCKHLACP